MRAQRYMGATILGILLIVLGVIAFIIAYSAQSIIGAVLCACAVFPVLLGAILLVIVFTGDEDDDGSPFCGPGHIDDEQP